MRSEVTVEVQNELGLHARPAAAFVKAAAHFAAAVQVYNLTTGKGPAPARSILAVLALGVRQGHQVRLSAEGEQAEQALAALADLLLEDAEEGEPLRDKADEGTGR